MLVVCVSYQLQQLLTLSAQPNIILHDKQVQNISLKKEVSVVVGIQVPEAVYTEVGSTLFSQISFQGTAILNNDCMIFFNNVNNNELYAIYKMHDEFLQFQVEISEKENKERPFIYINITSICNIKLEFVAAAVQQFNGPVGTLTHLSPQNTFLAHKHEKGVNKWVQFDFDPDDSVIIFICSSPVSLNMVWFDCQYDILENGSNIYINVSQYNYYPDYIYYSLETIVQGGKLIKADITDIYEVGINDKKEARITAFHSLHYQLSENISIQYKFEVTQIDSGVIICFTEKFEFPEDAQCNLNITKTGKFKITPEMKHILVQTSEQYSSVEFQVSEIQKDKNNNYWIIWVVISIVLVVLVVILVFFFIRRKNYNKIEDKVQQDNDILIDSDK
ncbi:Conserved_hypothetical protein [Hexamita inflata]|uniref:Transmembrane protein n=1 Tax=Hexamita inflata TaxID=28002 RepID=A0AA86PV19_9EUKA|nr:Conserved hypothetical protein [Hexamita inflata]